MVTHSGEKPYFVLTNDYMYENICQYNVHK